MPRNVLLIGSIPLGSAREVFETVAARLGPLVRRIPDGENGERLDWISWQSSAFARSPFIEPVSQAGGDEHNGLPRFRVRPGFPAAAVRFGELGYAAAAIESHGVFRELKASGRLAPDCRMQIGMATALSVVGQYVDAEFQAAIEPAYEAQLLEEIDRIIEAVPAGDLAIQWNLATEISIMERHRQVHFDKIADGVFERMVRLCEHVPDGVELGLHLCYHDFEHNNFPLPGDLDRVVDLANGILGSVGRAIDWVHIPAPSALARDEYFAPLRRLLLRPETEFYLGLVHGAAEGDGAEGAGRRIVAAEKALKNFGIASDCGLGNVPAGDIGGVLDLHREVAEGG